jgi:uncharacterized protein (DUF697 family)
MDTACSITFAGGVCNAIIVVASIAVLIWLDSKVSNHQHGPDYTMVLVMWIVIIPAACASTWVCAQPWAYDWKACNALMDAKREIALRYERQQQLQREDLQWLRELRERESKESL